MDGKQTPEVCAAMEELRLELAGFSHDGLTQLLEDLRDNKVVRGSWEGCPLSYRDGRPGSVHHDRLGRRRNNFTVAWDYGLAAEEVILLVEQQLEWDATPTKRPQPFSQSPAALTVLNNIL